MNDEDLKPYLRTLVEFLVIIFLVLGVPYLISGLWPPFVSVISGSMEPNINQGDMILVESQDRFNESDTFNGVETSQMDEGNLEFGRQGDVIVYRPDGKRTVPVIHRVITYVEKGEDWTDDVRPDKLPTQSCERLVNCPAPNSGFITLGDNNVKYDQAGEISKPVKNEWIIGRAKYRIPYLGWIKIFLSSAL